MTDQDDMQLARIRSAMQEPTEMCERLHSASGTRELIAALAGHLLESFSISHSEAVAVLTLADVDDQFLELHNAATWQTVWRAAQPFEWMLRFAAPAAYGAPERQFGDYPQAVLEHIREHPERLRALHDAHLCGMDLMKVIDELGRLDDENAENFISLIAMREQERRDGKNAVDLAEDEVRNAMHEAGISAEPDDKSGDFVGRLKRIEDAVTDLVADDDTGDDSPDGPGAA